MKYKVAHTVTISRDDKLVLCTVVGEFWPAHGGLSVEGGPPEGAELNVLSLKRQDTSEELVTTLSDEEYDSLCDQVEEIEGSYPDPDDERDNDRDFEDDGDYLDRKFGGNW